MILSVINAVYAIPYRGLKNSGLQRGLNPGPHDTVRRSNQLSYEATDVKSWSSLQFVMSPVRNECEMNDI